MVLAQRHAPLHALHLALSQVQPQRVLGIAGAITVNVAALMLLMIPVSAPMLADGIETVSTTIVFVDPIKPKPIPVVDPVERKQESRDPKPVIAPQPKPARSDTPVLDDSPLVDDGTDIAPPHVDRIVDPPATGGGEIGASAQLEYASAPPPTYPREALLDNLEGTVLLKVLVDVDGKPLSVEIARSSGHRALDEAARRQVLRKWKFQPAMQNGTAIRVYGMVPVNFSLSLQ